MHEQTANVIQAAGQAIGLDIQTKVIPVEQFGNLYFDPAARAGIDGFFTTNYGSFADALDVYQFFASTDSHNYTGWDLADEPLFAARAETDDAARAEQVIEAQRIITEQLPWIPLAYEPVTLVQNDRISGARILRLPLRAVGGHDRRGGVARMSFGAYLARRTGGLLLVLLVTSFIVFGLLYLAPGSRSPSSSDRAAAPRSRSPPSRPSTT